MTPDPGARPCLSFLTPAYRTEAYLPATIDSVLRQSSPDWELVVVDNGNSDEVAQIVGRYADDPRIRLLRQDNRGYVGGVMAAAAVARGAFLSVLDSDDELMPHFVETISGYLRAHPTVDAVGCDAHLFLDGESHVFGRGYLQSTGTVRPAPDGDRLDIAQVLSGRVPYYTGAVRREAWDAVGGYDPGVPDVDESVLIWLRLAAEYDVRLLPQRLARYRVRDQSLSRDPHKVEEFERVLIATFERFAVQSGRHEHIAAVQPTLRRLRYHQALRRARLAFVTGDVPGARRWARAAFRQRRTLRSTAVLASVTVAPRVLRVAYPVKQQAGALARRLTHPSG